LFCEINVTSLLKQHSETYHANGKTTKSTTFLIVKYQLSVKLCELRESIILQIWNSKSFYQTLLVNKIYSWIKL